MPTYTATFRGDTAWACQDFEADTPEQALARARQFYEECRLDLDYEPYDALPMINEIEISDDHGETRDVWLDQDLRLRLGAGDLLEAARKVVARWEQGDLAEAVRELDAAIATATGGAP